MKIPDFKLEEFWKKYEFTSPYLLCCSDAETWTLSELLEIADEDSKKLWNSLALGYTESPGHPILRQEIANLYDSIHADDVLTLAGAEEGIYCVMRILIQPGDHVIVIDPCYQSLATLPKAFGGEITAIPLRFENEWKLDLEAVKNAFRSNTKLLVLNYPHNPTGTVLDRKMLDELTLLARKAGAYIFCDEVYRYLEIDETQRMPSIADVYEKGISLNVMTKSFGLAGLRIGWIATRDRHLLTEVGSYKLYTSICNSAPSEILAILALRAKDQILKRNREIVLTNLKLLDEFMKRNRKSLSWHRPQSGTMAVIKLLLPIPIERFAEDLVQKEGILIMPSSVFDLPGNFFRIGFGRTNMGSILEKFEAYLNRKKEA